MVLDALGVLIAVAAVIATVYLWASDRAAARVAQANRINAWMAYETPEPTLLADSPGGGVERVGLVISNSSDSAVFDFDFKVMRAHLRGDTGETAWSDAPTYPGLRLGIVPPGVLYLALEQRLDSGSAWVVPEAVMTENGVVKSVGRDESQESFGITLTPMTATEARYAPVFLRFRDVDGRVWLRGENGRLRPLGWWAGLRGRLWSGARGLDPVIDRRALVQYRRSAVVEPVRRSLPDFVGARATALAPTRVGGRTEVTDDIASLLRRTANLLLAPEDSVPTSAEDGKGFRRESKTVSASSALAAHVAVVQVTGAKGMGLRLVPRREGGGAVYALEGNATGEPIGKFYFGVPKRGYPRDTLVDDLRRRLPGVTTAGDLTPQRLLTALTEVVVAQEEKRLASAPPGALTESLS